MELNPPGGDAEAGADGTDAAVEAADGGDKAADAAGAEGAVEDAKPNIEANMEGTATNGEAAAPASGQSALLTAPPKLVLKLGKAATASLKAAAAAKAQKLAAASAAGGGGSAAPPSPPAPTYSFPSASLSASESYDLLGGNSAASSSWSPTDRAGDSGGQLPLDLRDEVISPPTTFAEANGITGIPEAHPAKPKYTEVLGGKQCSICLHVLRAWAGTHIKSHEQSNKHKEAIERRQLGIPLGGRRRKPKPPKPPRKPKEPKPPKDKEKDSKRKVSRARKPAGAKAGAADGEAKPAKASKAAAAKGSAEKKPAAAKKAATKRKAPAGKKDDDAAFPKVVKRRRN